LEFTVRQLKITVRQLTVRQLIYCKTVTVRQLEFTVRQLKITVRQLSNILEYMNLC